MVPCRAGVGAANLDLKLPRIGREHCLSKRLMATFGLISFCLIVFLSARMTMAKSQPQAGQQTLSAEESAGDAAVKQGQLREAFQHYMNALTGLPTEGVTEDIANIDRRLREKIIKVVLQLNPQPAIPQDAVRHTAYAQAAVKEAKDEADLKDAVNELKIALQIAPWWGEQYKSLAYVLEKANRPGEAQQALQLYLLADPNTANAQDVQMEIYALQYEAENRQTENIVQAPVTTRFRAGPSGYVLNKTIPVPGDTFWDYLNFDPSTRRLFISHGDRVAVVDDGKVIGDIGGMERVHGIVLAPEFNRGFVTDGQGAKVWIFDLRMLKITGSTPTDADANGEVYDLASKRVFTMNGDSKTSSVIDAATGQALGEIDLGGQPGFPVADGQGHIYANIESTGEIVEIDSSIMKISRRWPLTPCQSPSGLAMDTKNRILFFSCHDGIMAIVDANTGEVIATPAIGQGADATRFDLGTGYAFASNGDGTLTVIHEDSRTQFRVVENVTTERGARTMAIDPTTHEVFLVTSKIERIPNPPVPTRPFRVVPGTFHVLVFSRANNDR